MQYRDLRQKNVYIFYENEKVCSDVQDFFSELNVYEGGTLALEDTGQAQELMRTKTTDDMLLVAVLDKTETTVEKLAWLGEYELGVDYIDMAAVFAMTDELETFYIDKMRAGRRIVVYGTEEAIAGMKRSNPHLRIDEEIKQSADDVEKLAAEKAKNDVFVIVADSPNVVMKSKLENEVGLIFGEEFHFYNKRVPKHPTSYYLKKTMLDKPIFTLECDQTTRALSLKKRGNVMACCSSVSLAFGSVLYTSMAEVLSGVPAQVVDLSVKNRTYSFCVDMCFMYRDKNGRLTDSTAIAHNGRLVRSRPNLPDYHVQIGYDRSCNLACPSCRTCRITQPEDNKPTMHMIHDEAKRMARSGLKNIRIGNGEVFFSPYYKDIIFNFYEAEHIALISNGLLFNSTNWEKLRTRYKKVQMEFSVDAATASTYKKIRGGRFDILLRNLEFAAELRRSGELAQLVLAFVVQVDNFREMPDFVRLGQRLSADRINFRKLNNWGFIREADFIKKDVYNPANAYHVEFIELLKDPLLHTENVHVDNIGNFI